MRCTTYCTAASYDLTSAIQLFQENRPSQPFRDCLHFVYLESGLTKGEVFVFSYGSVVFWEMELKTEEKLLQQLQIFQKNSISKMEIDELTFSYGQRFRIKDDEIILDSHNLLDKLAISYGLAQSLKLATFEERIQKIIDQTTYLPEDLAVKGKISMSCREIRRKMGVLFIERTFINLHADFDTPEFFWDSPELEPLYRETIRYLDVIKRVEALNKRLMVIHELLEILSNELNHQRSFRLEWIIITLISSEIALSLYLSF